jgi:cytidyltransferase-like protein
MIVTLNDLADIRPRHPGKEIILTSGTYDLFHVGHLYYLSNLKTSHNILVVMLSSDHRARARKGPNRPIIPEADRLQILNALKVVDYVFTDPSKRAPYEIDPIHAEIAARLQPDRYVTYCLVDNRFSTVMDKSKLTIAPRTNEPSSTTAIIERIVRMSQKNHTSVGVVRKFQKGAGRKPVASKLDLV